MRVASYNSYRRIRRIHVDPALGQVLAGKLTRAQLSTYYAAKMRGSKKKKPLAETTVAHHHAMLKTAYNWALEEELLLVNPALRVKNPPALRPKTRPVWSMGEIAQHRDQGEGPAGPRRRRARRLLGPARRRDCGPPLVRPRPRARLRHRVPHHRGGRRRHAARVPAEERQGADGAAARRRLRRAARLARRAEGVPPGSGSGVERGGEGRAEEGRQPDGALDPQEPVVELGGPPEDRPAPADPRPARLLRHLGLRDLRRQAGAGVARALRPGDHAAALRAPHHRRAGEGGGGARRGDAGRAGAGRAKAAEDALPAPTTSSRWPVGAADSAPLRPDCWSSRRRP